MKEYTYLIYYDRNRGTYDPKFQIHLSLRGAKKAVEQMMKESTEKYEDTWQQIAQSTHFWQWESDGGEYLSITRMKVHE
jgi:hypothetical protein